MAGEQEIKLKLTADTAQAVKSVKDLEQTVAGIDKIKSKGEKEKGFLSKEDVNTFKQLSRETELVYKNFLSRFDTIKRDIERRKSDLEKSLMSENNSVQDTRRIEAQLRNIEAQRVILDSQMRKAEQLQARAQNSSGQIGNMNAENSLSILAGGMGGKAMGMLAGTLAAGALFNQARQGMSQVKSEEELMAMLGNRIGGYGGDYQKAREEALKTGKINNYGAMETIQLADQYSSLAGNKNVFQNVADIQGASRAMGVDPSLLATTGGMMQRLGALGDGEQRKFAELLAGSIVKQGMAGRDRELIESVSSLAQSTAQGRVGISGSDLDQLVGLQTLLGSKEEAWKGEKGTSVLNSIDQSIKGGDSRIDALLGWGSEFQGVTGRANLERMKAKGLTDPENVKRIFSNIDSLNESNDYKALLVSDIFGISIEEADRLMKDDIKSTLKSGGLSKAEMEDLIGSGGSSLSTKGDEYSNSEASQRSKFDIEMEEFKKTGGEFLDSIFYPIAGAFGQLPEGAQWALGGAGTIGATLLGKKALTGLKGLFTGKVKDVGKAGKLGKLGAGGKLNLGGASKLLGPLGFLTSALAARDLGADMGDGVFDWLLGHKEGDLKDVSLTGKQTFYEDTRQGALSKGWDWITPWQTKSEKEKELQKENELEEKKKKNSELEKQNIEDKKKVVEEETALKKLGEFGVIGKENSSLKGDDSFGKVIDLFSRNSDILANTPLGFQQRMTQNLFGGGGGTGTSILGGTRGLSAKDINDYIASKAPKGSVLRGQGDAFLKASKETGLDVAYLIAHAAHETGWGTSKIAKEKGNMYGIGAFDSSPYASAYGYDSTTAGIIEGAKWIKKNYADAGQNTLESMRHNGGVHEYATDPLWDEKISKIMQGMSRDLKLSVNVSGSIDGLNAKNNDKVTQALVDSLNSGSLNLGYGFNLGVGGNR